MDPMTLMSLMGMMGGGGQGQDQRMGGGLAQLFGGLFGNSGSPYDKAQQAYQPYFDQATNAQQPYNQAGQNAMGSEQDMLKQMSDPSGFMNKLMGQYQESPWAKYSQQQGMRTAQNLGSASGLGGSTPMMQQAQQNSQGIASQDMQNWLTNALGINTQALNGYDQMRQGGQNSANTLSQLFGQGAENMAGFGYGQQAGKNQDQNNIWGGLGNIFGSFFK